MYDCYMLLDEDQKPIKVFTSKKDLETFIEQEDNDASEYNDVIIFQGCLEMVMTILRED